MASELMSQQESEIAYANSRLKRKPLTRKQARTMMFWQYFGWWTEMYKEGRISSVTIAKYVTYEKVLYLIAPKMTLGDLDHSRFNVQMLVDLYGKTHRSKTTYDFKSHVFAVLRSAVDDGHIDNAATSQITVNSLEQHWTPEQRAKTRFAPKTMSETEYKLFKTRVDMLLSQSLSHDVTGRGMDEQAMLMMLAVLLHTGCRFAEALAVTAQDFNGHLLTIDKTWNYRASADAAGFRPTKNPASIRKVTIDDTLTDDVTNFMAWKSHQYPGTEDKPLSFIPGKRWFNSTLNAYFRNLQNEYGIKESLSIHKIRHTYISFLLSQNIDENVIARQVGHTDTSMIRRVYGHLMAERRNKDQLRIEALMK
jgi:integrase